MPAIGPAKVKSRNSRSGRISANALIWRARSARFRRRLSGTVANASAPVEEADVTGSPTVTGHLSPFWLWQWRVAFRSNLSKRLVLRDDRFAVSSG
ncbi:hypothetical protein ACVW0I_006395 [Bradyrhizobium sp. LM6.11]